MHAVVCRHINIATAIYYYSLFIGSIIEMETLGSQMLLIYLYMSGEYHQFKTLKFQVQNKYWKDIFMCQGLLGMSIIGCKCKYKIRIIPFKLFARLQFLQDSLYSCFRTKPPTLLSVTRHISENRLKMRANMLSLNLVQKIRILQYQYMKMCVLRDILLTENLDQ